MAALERVSIFYFFLAWSYYLLLFCFDFVRFVLKYSPPRLAPLTPFLPVYGLLSDAVAISKHCRAGGGGTQDSSEHREGTKKNSRLLERNQGIKIHAVTDLDFSVAKWYSRKSVDVEVHVFNVSGRHTHTRQ